MPAGYSGTPLAKKLGIKPGVTVVALGAPADYLVDVKVCAVDATWSGLKFVYRLKDR